MLRPITLSACLLALTCGQSSQAQDLYQYDMNNYSGGYAEGAYSPLGEEQLYPYDSQDQWQHGYIQYMPFYGAYKHFRPYNYLNVGAQTQAAAGWGMSPRMPYSQQFWHRYHEHSKMGHPASGAYESYLDVPVPQRPGANSEQQETDEQAPPPRPNPPGVYQPGPQASPRPFNTPGLNAPGMNSPAYPSSAQHGYGRGPDDYSGVSYRSTQQSAYAQPAPAPQGFGQPSYNQSAYAPPNSGQNGYLPPGYGQAASPYAGAAPMGYQAPPTNPTGYTSSRYGQSQPTNYQPAGQMPLQANPFGQAGSHPYAAPQPTFPSGAGHHVYTQGEVIYHGEYTPPYSAPSPQPTPGFSQQPVLMVP